MKPVQVSGTEGYAEEAEALVTQYESVSFSKTHEQILHLIPVYPCSVLDIGSGTGRDAAGFAALGHRVVAVEPTAELRNRAMALHPSPDIEWLDDNLPRLSCLEKHSETFDVVMLTAVWMLLDKSQRQLAMPKIAGLMRKGGIVVFLLRHGPVPSGRRMFAVSAEETRQLADTAGLQLILRLENQADPLGRPDVKWTRLRFSRSDTNLRKCWPV